MPFEYSAVGSACVTVLLQVGLLVLALAYVRKANAMAAYVLAGGAGFRILTTCCVDFGGFGLMRTGNYELVQMLSIVFRLANLLDFVVFWGAVAFAAVTLARAISAGATTGGANG